MATLFFSIQIYCDFSGYSDIAIGTARVMGFKLMTNFNRPYFARTISEFWKRWHISLSTWFKDYLYISLGGSRVSVPRWYFNLFIVFLVSGLWHGANWTYIIWGAINGFYLVFALVTQDVRTKLTRLSGLQNFPRLNLFIQVSTTYILACFAWIFFRANNIHQAGTILRKIFSPKGGLYIPSSSIMMYSFVGILFLFLVEFKHEYFNRVFTLSNHTNRLVPKLYYCFLIIAILLIGVFDGGQFIYFQF